MVNTYESLKNDIIKLGIKPDDTIMIHSSLKKLGETEGGGDTLLDVFCDYLGQDGLFIVPCHTWRTVRDYNYTYNKNMESNLGVLPNLFRVRENVERSLHPTHSVCAYGKGAKEFVTTPLPQNTPCKRDGCYGKFYDIGGKILLLGVTLTVNTFFHAIEEWESGGIPWWYEQKPLHYKITLENGETIDNYMHPSTVGTSERFDRAMEYVLNEPSTKTGKIGNADCILIDAKKIDPVIAKLLKEQPDIFTKE